MRIGWSWRVGSGSGSGSEKGRARGRREGRRPRRRTPTRSYEPSEGISESSWGRSGGSAPERTPPAERSPGKKNRLQARWGERIDRSGASLDCSRERNLQGCWTKRRPLQEFNRRLQREERENRCADFFFSSRNEISFYRGGGARAFYLDNSKCAHLAPKWAHLKSLPFLFYFLLKQLSSIALFLIIWTEFLSFFFLKSRVILIDSEDRISLGYLYLNE